MSWLPWIISATWHTKPVILGRSLSLFCVQNQVQASYKSCNRSQLHTRLSFNSTSAPVIEHSACSRAKKRSNLLYIHTHTHLQNESQDGSLSFLSKFASDEASSHPSPRRCGSPANLLLSTDFWRPADSSSSSTSSSTSILRPFSSIGHTF